MQFETAGLRHFLDSGERFQSTKQDASRQALRLAGHVQTIVIAIDEVHIGMTGRTKYDGIAQSLAGCGVCGGISLAQISLDLDDPRAQGRPVFLTSHQYLPDKLARNLTRLSSVESP
jgi:hypothetical protein